MHQQFTLRLTRVVGALALSVIFAASAMAVAHEAPPPICTTERGAEKEKCSPSRHPESLDELTTLHRDRASHLASPFAFAPMGAHASALRERMTLATTPSSIPNANGTWRPYGKTPLIANHRDYRSVNQLGFVHLGGRIDDLFYDESSGRLFAAFGSGGGVWLSENKGDFWRPIGESLPTQVVASVAWTAAAGGRVLALTGEPTFGHYSQTGLGAYYSDDLGTTWNKASGIPDGMFGFKLAIDPVNPGIVYAATGRGLYRSADGGASYADVVLPTGACAGKFDLSTCLFANIVTDVVVQAPDNFGNPGGAVMAAVGWRAGRAKNPNGSEQSTGNGIYVSPSGEPARSFNRSTASPLKNALAAPNSGLHRERTKTTTTYMPSCKTRCFCKGAYRSSMHRKRSDLVSTTLSCTAFTFRATSVKPGRRWRMTTGSPGIPFRDQR